MLPPLVSCIMPTRDRRDFVRQSLLYFQRQTFKDVELVVVDDGEDSVEDLCDIPRVRYVRSEPVKIGTARNVACEAAKGSIIVHWDDDDWQAPTRVHSLMSILSESQARLIGLRDPVYLNTQSLEFLKYYFKPDKPWVAGHTMCYFKTLWQEHNFEDEQIGEDNTFCSDIDPNSIHQSQNNLEIIGLIHKNNTSTKELHPTLWSKFAYLANHMGEDWSFYERLAHAQTY